MKLLSNEEIENMRVACRITAGALDEISKHIVPGTTALELDRVAREYITSQGAKPTFLHYGGFPASVCVSIDDVVVHGIPKADMVLEEGQIVSIDIGAKYKGVTGDAARTYPVGKIDAEKQKLIDVTKQCFFKAIENLKAGSRVGDIGAMVQRNAEKHGYGVVRDMTGHGVGRNLHEDPAIPNFGMEGTGEKLVSGETIAIEPMINMGTWKVKIDGWDCRTADGLPSAHYENTVLVNENNTEILTKTADLEANNLE